MTHDHSPAFRLQRTSGLRVSDEALLDDLRRVFQELGASTVGQKTYRSRAGYDDSTVTRRVGSWNNPLERAGLSVSNRLGYR